MPDSVAFKNKSAMVIVLASKGYPESYPKGEVVIEPTETVEGSVLIHAGTKTEDGKIVTSGGRVRWCSWNGGNFGRSKRNAYELAEAVKFESKYFRTDIGHHEFSRF